MSARHGWPDDHHVRYRCHDCGSIHEIDHVRRNLYLGSRALGDVSALQRGGFLGLGRRLVRRRITRTLLKGLWGN
jgi:hypothetical protein